MTSLLLILVSAVPSRGQSLEVTATLAEARAARNAKDFGKAIRLLEAALAADPVRLETYALLAETLAWDKKFKESEKVYRRGLERDAESRDLRIGLARVLLWQKRFIQARRALKPVLRKNRFDVDALEIDGFAAYWSGDTRGALRSFQHVLRQRPGSPEVLRSVREIEAAARPAYEVGAESISDDQPFRLLSSEVAASYFSDPLTRWDVSAGLVRLDDPDRNRSVNLPSVKLGGEVHLPRWKLTVSPSIRRIRMPDDEERTFGSVTFRRNLTNMLNVRLHVGEQEILRTATSLDNHPSVQTYGLSWRLEHPSLWLANVSAGANRYYDENEGVFADFYVLAPFRSSGRFQSWAGFSSSYRDTDADRFILIGIDSRARSNGEFDYRYRGAYDPYWTPHDLREFRLIAVAEGKVRGNIAAKIQLDGGYSRDEAVAFGPASGVAPRPPSSFSFFFERDFFPWHLLLSAAGPLLQTGLEWRASFEHHSTPEYRADSIHASLAGRF